VLKLEIGFTLLDSFDNFIQDLSDFKHSLLLAGGSLENGELHVVREARLSRFPVVRLCPERVFVITIDLLNSGIHFLPEESANLPDQASRPFRLFRFVPLLLLVSQLLLEFLELECLLRGQFVPMRKWRVVRSAFKLALVFLKIDPFLNMMLLPRDVLRHKLVRHSFSNDRLQKVKSELVKQDLVQNLRHNPARRFNPLRNDRMHSVFNHSFSLFFHGQAFRRFKLFLFFRVARDNLLTEFFQDFDTFSRGGFVLFHCEAVLFEVLMLTHLVDQFVHQLERLEVGAEQLVRPLEQEIFEALEREVEDRVGLLQDVCVYVPD